MLISGLPYFTAFVVGAIIGSFLNVVIHRLPRGESLVRPPSHCPHCDRPVPPWENIPLFSYILLRGRCRHCRHPISMRYPLVEGATALVFLGLAFRFGFGLQAVVWSGYCSALIAIVFIDLDHMIIPHSITVPGMGVGLATTFWVQKESSLASMVLGIMGLDFNTRYPVYFADSLGALVIGGGFFTLAAVLSEKILGKEGMGGGDIMLTAMMGSFLGIERLIVAIFIALFTGSATALILIFLGRKSRKDIIPFGPFLALGGMSGIFWGSEIVDWYVRIGGL